FNANGGSGQFVYNFNKWIGVAVEGGAANKGVLNGADVDTTVAHVVAGPRISYHNHSRFTPFGEVLFGGAFGTTSTQIPVIPVAGPASFLPVPIGVPISARIQASNSGFAMMAGGGLDIKMSKHVAFRPLEFDYYLTRLPNLLTGDDTNKNNWRYSA